MLGEKGGAASCKGSRPPVTPGSHSYWKLNTTSKNRHSPRLTCGMILQAA